MSGVGNRATKTRCALVSPRGRIDDIRETNGAQTKDQYDLTDAEQGKFYRPLEELGIPIYMDKDNREYFIQKLRTRKTPLSLNEVVNASVRKDIEISKKLVDQSDRALENNHVQGEVTGDRQSRGGTMKQHPRITVDPNICGGWPCIRGMRIRVSDILDMLACGASQTDILEDYPYLEAADIAAALEFAARQTDHPVLRVA